MIFDTKSVFRRERMATRIRERLGQEHSDVPSGALPRPVTGRDVALGILVVLGLALFLFLPIFYLAFLA